MVSVLPRGPLMVTVWTFRSTAVMVAVTTTSRPTAPENVSPGREVVLASVTLTPGAAAGTFLTSSASASMKAATTGSPTATESSFLGSFTSSVTVPPRGPFKVTVRLVLSMASIQPRTVTMVASPTVAATAGASSALGRLVEAQDCTDSTAAAPSATVRILIERPPLRPSRSELPAHAEQVAYIFLLRSGGRRRVVAQLHLGLGEEALVDRRPQAGVHVQVVVAEPVRDVRQILEVVEELERLDRRPVDMIGDPRREMVFRPLRVLEVLVHPGQAGLRVEVEGRRLEPLIAHPSADRQPKIELGDVVLLDADVAVEVELLRQEVVVLAQDVPVVDGRLVVAGVLVLLPAVVVRGAQGDPIDLAAPHAVEAEPEVLGLGIAGGDQRVAHDRPGPLDRRRIDPRHVLERDGLRRAPRDWKDLHRPVRSGADLRADERITGLDHDRLVGRERLDVFQVHRDLAAPDLDDELAPLGAHDLSGQPIAVQEQDLVGPGAPAESQRDRERAREHPEWSSRHVGLPSARGP